MRTQCSIKVPGYELPLLAALRLALPWTGYTSTYFVEQCKYVPPTTDVT